MDHAYSHLSIKGLFTMSAKILIILVRTGVQPRSVGMETLANGGIAIVLAPIVPALPWKQQQLVQHMGETRMGNAYFHMSIKGICTMSAKIMTTLELNGVQQN